MSPRSRKRALWLLAAALLLVGVAFFVQRHQESKRLPSEKELSRADAWLPFGGTWSGGSPIVNTSEERGAKLISRAGPFANVKLEADVQISEPFGDAGLLLRTSGEEEGVDAYHGYYLGVRPVDATWEFGRADFGWRPLIRKAVPRAKTTAGWFHLRIVSVGCRYAISVTFPQAALSGSTPFSAPVTSSEIVDLPGCLTEGHFGLRSQHTSAQWKNIHVTPASPPDLISTTAPGAQPANEALPIPAPPLTRDIANTAAAYTTEANRHAFPPGASPIQSTLMSPGIYPNTTIQGTVIATLPLLDVQDDTGTLVVNPDSPVNVKLGDVIRAEGTLVSERFRIHLSDAKVRVLWSDVAIPPLAVNAEELTGGTYRGRFIELEGTLISANTTSEGYQLLLRDRETTFSAVGSNDFHLEANSLRPGSRLRLQGTATSLSEFTHDLYPFIVVVNRVDVIAPPPWWSPEHIALIIAAIVVLFLGAQYLLHRIQQWHLRAILKEREQLAYEMHDTLSQSFTGITYQLEAANLERRGESQIRQHIQNALRMVHLSHREASRTIAALRPQFRDAAAILAALRGSALRMSDGGTLEITTQLRGKNRHLPIQIADALYRIGQEAISNAIQHADGKRLEIELNLTSRDVVFSVHDNGRGFTPGEITGTLGLSGMRARAARIKAMLEIHSQPGAGTTILVKAQLRFAGSLLYRLRTTLSPYPES